MRFLVDECTGPAVARWLRDLGHDVLSAYDEARGTADLALLERACAEDRVVLTNDKDFGELVVRDQKSHRGIVLLRIQDERAASKIAAIQRLLDSGESPEGRFIVVTSAEIRVTTH